MFEKYEQQKKYQQQQAQYEKAGRAARAEQEPANVFEANEGQNVASMLLNEEMPPVAESGLADRCRAEICPTCPVKAEAEDTKLRALAEMDNFKKRLQREKDEQMKYAAEPVLQDLLPVLDNLELAIRYAGKEEACRDLLTGVSMTHKILLDVVRQHGIIPVGAEGEPFDPDRHEAVAQEDRTDLPPGYITVLHQRGYMLKERLLRPAKVSVSRDPAGD